jgi:hypothetical protein
VGAQLRIGRCCSNCLGVGTDRVETNVGIVLWERREKTSIYSSMPQSLCVVARTHLNFENLVRGVKCQMFSEVVKQG